MIIEILVCRADGTQELVQSEVPEDYFGPAEEPETAEIGEETPGTENEPTENGGETAE